MVQITYLQNKQQKVQTTRYKTNKLQGYIVQHREYSQYFIITLRKKN